MSDNNVTKASLWDLIRALFFENQNGQWVVKWETYQALRLSWAL